MCAAVEEERASRMVAMRQQGALTRWEQAVEQKVLWPELWKAESHGIMFSSQLIYDVLPSPSNLLCWGKTYSPACPLCLKAGTLELLPKSPGQGALLVVI